VICDRHDVVVVPFPFQEIEFAKRRPALVVSASYFNKHNGWTVIAMITSARSSQWHSDMQIADLEAAGLNHPCVMRPRFQTLPNELLVRKLGSFGPVDRLGAERIFAEMLTAAA
jgi:mRNA interferase MazF